MPTQAEIEQAYQKWYAEKKLNQIHLWPYFEEIYKMGFAHGQRTPQEPLDEPRND